MAHLRIWGLTGSLLVTQVNPKCHHKYPYGREAEDRCALTGRRHWNSRDSTEPPLKGFSGLCRLEETGTSSLSIAEGAQSTITLMST